MPNGMSLLTDSGFAEIADDAAFDPTADVEWRFDVDFDGWPPVDEFLASRYVSTGDNRQWQIFINDFDDGRFDVSIGASDGTFRTTLFVDILDGFAGGRAQILAQLDADDGASNTVLTVFTRTGANIQDLESDTDWTSEGTASIAGVQSWKALAETMRFGNNHSAAKHVEGRLHRYIMWTDLTKTTKVADVDFTDEANIDAGATNDDTWNDAASANDWTMQGTHETDWDYIREFAAAAKMLLLGVGGDN